MPLSTPPGFPSLSDIRHAADQIVLDRFAPAGVLINEIMQVIQFRGRTNAFLEPAQGQASLNLLTMVPFAVAEALAEAFAESMQRNAIVRRAVVVHHRQQAFRTIAFEVIPIKVPSMSTAYLVLFEESNPVGTPRETGEPAPAAGVVAAAGDSAPRELVQMRIELSAATDYTHSLVELNHGLNEQLRDAQEEVQSSAEEFRSTNEELENTMAELEASNQEFISINDRLRESENRYRRIVETANEGIWEFDAEARTNFVNPKMADMLGYSVAEMLGRAQEDFMKEEGRTITARHHLQRQQGVAAMHDVMLRRKDGGELWALMATNPIKDSTGAYAGAMAMVTDITERKAQQQRLAASEQRYRALFDATPIPCALNDASQRILLLNAAFIKTFGYTVQDIPTLADWWPKAYPDPVYRQRVAETWQEHLGAAARSSTTFEPLEVTIRCKGGSQVVAMVGAESLAGSVEGLHLVVLYDITAHKIAEVALRNSEMRWRFAIEGAGDGVWDWQVPDNTVFFSHRWKLMLGYADHEIGSDHSEWSSRIHPDDLSEVMAELQAHLDGHAPSYVHEHRIRCKDGSYKWILGRGLVMSRDAAGRPLRMVGTHADITDRRLAEAAVKDSESRFRALFDGATEAIITMDESGTVLSVNRSAETTFGFTAHELIGTRLEAIFPTPQQGDGPSFLHRYLDPGARRIMGTGQVVEALCKDGVCMHLNLSISEARTGQYRIFMVLLRDLTAELLAAEAKKQLETQLFQAMKMESLGVLAGGIAHDFNNILTSILGYTDLVKQWNATDARTVKALGQVMAAGNRASDLVKQILTFSRIGAQTKALCDLGQLVQEVSTLMQVGRPRNIKYHVSGSEQKYLIVGDSSQIHQVLTNLCTNAIQAMPSGGRLAVMLDACSFAPGEPRPDSALRDETYCRIRVQDSGTGIPDHIKSQIFDPFFSTKGAQGTGLGLSVAHGIISRHRGAITVDSQVNSGTVFSIYLPTVVAETNKLDEAHSAMATGAWRILVLGETGSLRASTQDMLIQMGYNVDVFASPSLAKPALMDLKLKYGLVLSEVDNTKADIDKLCEELRSLQGTVPIGVITPNLDVSDWASLKAVGVSFILTAPFTYFELARDIAQFVIPGMTSTKEPE